MSSLESSNRLRSIRSLCLLSLLILTCYSSTFNAAWHLDDLPNIVNNAPLHLEHLSIKSLKQTLTASPVNPGEQLYRPLPCLSFALNWFMGRDNPIGYHAVNLSVHLTTAFFLFMTIRLLLVTPAVKKKDPILNSHFIALLATLLWALNPVQTQAVTYIVQRMAAMAAMFTIIGLYFYLKARMSYGQERWIWFIFTFMAFCCALLSKENAVLFPFSVLMIEYIFFRAGTFSDQIKTIFSVKNLLIGLGVVAILCGLILLLTGNPIDLSRYPERPFSIWQRLISQPRVVMLYLSLLLYPAPWRLSFEHNMLVSTSLFQPWTTLPGIAALSVIAAFGIVAVKRYPLIALAILFFLLNHMVESTILPLELVFEHRNYLPSLFLFLPAAFYVVKLLDRCQKNRRSLYTALVFCIFTNNIYRIRLPSEK